MLLKLRAYAIFRFVPFVPVAEGVCVAFIAVLAVIGILYDRADLLGAAGCQEAGGVLIGGAQGSACWGWWRTTRPAGAVMYT
ncbi:MAG: hypothetical protein R3B46_05190 [Phycisphaerales bacterium]